MHDFSWTALAILLLETPMLETPAAAVFKLQLAEKSLQPVLCSVGVPLLLQLTGNQAALEVRQLLPNPHMIILQLP